MENPKRYQQYCKNITWILLFISEDIKRKAENLSLEKEQEYEYVD